MLVSYLIVSCASLLTGIIFLILLKKLAVNHNILINKGIPVIGGMSMGLSFALACLLAVFLFNGLPKQATGIIVSSLIMLMFGILDDYRELSVCAKFFVQIVAASFLILLGVKTDIIYIGNIFNIIITFLWVLGITNAFNLLDIMDGAAAVVGIIVCLSFSVISFLNADTNTLALTLALAGAIASFLIYNLPPAKVYMGNSGSHFLGFVLAAIALTVRYASLETKIALVSPLFILGLPLFDTGFLIFIRLCKKKVPFSKSNDHLALRLLALGYSKQKVLLILLGLGLFFSLCGIALIWVSHPADLFIIVFAIITMFFLTNRMSKVAIHG